MCVAHWEDVCSSLVAHLAAVAAIWGSNPGILPNNVHEVKTREGEQTLRNTENKKVF